MSVNCIWQGPAALGEGPLWCVDQQCLYWIDIAGHRLHCLYPDTQQHQSWDMPALIGAIALHHEGGLIAAVGDAIVKIDLPSGEVTELINVIQGDTALRLNDGRCDRQGRFWVGVAHATTGNPRGGLYRYDPDGSIHVMETGITISNGLGWSPDDRFFYYTDSLRHCIYRYDYERQSGSISNRQIFARVPSQMEPDGLTVDTDGFIWSAQWNGAKVIRFSPSGDVAQEIILPTPRITSCALGGADLKTLFITSCCRNVDETTSLDLPAGSVFAASVSVAGIAEPAFGQQV